MPDRKQTSTRIAELAAKILCDPKVKKRDKALAGSAPAQARAPRKATLQTTTS